jgi:hypothetical protein
VISPLDLFGQLATNPWVTLTLLVLIVASIAAVFVVYYKSKRVRAPRFRIISNNIVSDLGGKDHNLSILHASPMHSGERLAVEIPRNITLRCSGSDKWLINLVNLTG